jgi:class 3 adenylate cyclase
LGAPSDKSAVDWVWHFDLPCRVEDIWPHLIDTSRMNRALGLERMEFQEQGGVLRGSSRLGGIRHEWVELPWSWIWGRELTLERVYDRGLFRRFRLRYELESVTGGCRLTLRFHFLPRGAIGRVSLALNKASLERRYRTVFEALAKEATVEMPSAFQAPPPELLPEARQRIAAVVRVLSEEPIRDDALRVLLQFVESADDLDAHRLQVRRLARESGVDETDLLMCCLYATRAGLLDLSWDVVCPHCRGTREELPKLSDVSSKGRCTVCDIDFDTAGPTAVEITFRVHSSIRNVPQVFYCSAEPARKSHIRAQLEVPAGSKKTIQPLLEPGLYRVRTKGKDGHTVIDCPKHGPFHVDLKNDGKTPAFMVLEELGWSDVALRPADLFGLQQFRDLFSEEYLGTDVQLHVGEQTLLFTDMVGSTRFYAERGDPTAFVHVKRHFAIIQDILRAQGGAFVKSIGDATMIVFKTPLEAVKVTRNILREFPPAAKEQGPPRLRASLHTGPCIAVNLNTAVDYFGGTVNVAAKLQKCAGAGDIAMSDAVLAAPGVKDFLQSQGAVLVPGTITTDAGPISHSVWKTDQAVPRASGTRSDADSYRGSVS